ncbi:hypothetical protein ACJMQP_03965 [Rhodopseudomonas palustris]
MAEVTEVVVSQTVRVNLGDYESVDFFVSMKATLNEDDTARAVAAALRADVQSSLVNAIGANFKARGRTVTAASIQKQYGLVRSSGNA